MKFKNKLLYFLFLFLINIPINTFAYSKYVIPGGETIGIEVNSKGVLVVGFYKVSDAYIGKDAGFMVGDKIIQVNNKEVSDISTMVNTINQSGTNQVEFLVNRDDKQLKINLELQEDNEGVLKTGLYVKDKITGIGTLTYIDPGTNIYGALGHEILESTTAEKFEIKDGKIFDADVTNIIKSRSGNAGEKNATYNRENVFGDIKNNSLSGIFGKYTKSYDTKEKLEVADKDSIKTGEATIRTVLKGDTVEEFNINILTLDDTSKTKNILFEIVDPKLQEAAGGIVQGMSGSPIIQDNKIIGAINYVIVNDTNKGYGIFITTMLEEGEK